MTGETSLGPVEGIVVACLVAPLGFAVAGVAGVDVVAPVDRESDAGWIAVSTIARVGRIQPRQARYHCERQVGLGHVERADVDALFDALPVGGRMRVPASRGNEPVYRWRRDVSPSLYDVIEPVTD